MRKKDKNSIINLPNILSLLRILLIPVFLLLMFQRKTLGAFLVFLTAGFTDVLDGFIARVWHLKTKLGALLDPAADKLLMTASYIILTVPALSSPNVIPRWLTIVVISRDLLIVSSVFFAYKLKGQKSFPPSIPGKICTVLQVTVILLVLFFNSIQVSSPYLDWFYLLTLIFTVFSVAHYYYLGIKIFFPPKKR